MNSSEDAGRILKRYRRNRRRRKAAERRERFDICNNSGAAGRIEPGDRHTNRLLVIVSTVFHFLSVRQIERSESGSFNARMAAKPDAPVSQIEETFDP